MTWNNRQSHHVTKQISGWPWLENTVDVKLTLVMITGVCEYTKMNCLPLVNEQCVTLIS